MKLLFNWISLYCGAGGAMQGREKGMVKKKKDEGKE